MEINKFVRKIIVIFSLVVSFTLRLYVYFVLVNHDSIGFLARVEPYGYISEATNIVNGGEWFMGLYHGKYQLLSFHPKGYTMLLVLLMIIMPNHYLMAAHIIMIILDVIAGLLIYMTCKSNFCNPNISAIALLLWAVNPFAIISCQSDLADSFGCFFISLVVFLYYNKRLKTIPKYVFLGITFGIMSSFRSEFLLLIILILVCDLYRHKSYKKCLMKWIWMICTFVIMLAPWMIYSYVKSGHVIVTSTTMWGSAYSTIGQKKDNAIHTGIGDNYVEAYAIEHGVNGAYMYDGNQFYKGKVIEYVMNYPNEYLELLLKYRLREAFIPALDIPIIMKNNIEWYKYNEPCVFIPANTIKRSMCEFASSSLYLLQRKYIRILSFILLCSAIVFLYQVIFKKEMKKFLLLPLIYLYFPIIISVIKGIEYRHIMPNQVVLIIMFAYIIERCANKLVSVMGPPLE